NLSSRSRQNITGRKMTLLADIRRDAEANHFHGAKAWLALAASPAMLTLVLYRMSSALYRSRGYLKILSLCLWRLNILLTGCHLNPRSMIGPGVTLPHPIGIVIGEGVCIGSNATIYQHVTLGTSNPSIPAYPRLGDEVTVFAGAVIVGDISVGDCA